MDNRVYIAECGSYEQEQVIKAVRECMAPFGGAAGILGHKKRVAIKPNLVIARKPEEASTTHPSIVEALASEFIAAGAEVVIADSMGGPYNLPLLKNIYKQTGMDNAAEASGAQLNYDTSSVRIRCAHPGKVPEFQVITPVAVADLVISVAKLKTHVLARMSGAVKNMYGVIPGLFKAVLHSRFPDIRDFAALLADLSETVCPGFSIIDGVVGMEGDGPTGGTLKKMGVLIGAANPYAADLAACAVMELDPDTVPLLSETIRRGLCPPSAMELQVLGMPIKSVSKAFKLPPYRNFIGGAAFLPKPIRKAAERLLVPRPVVDKSKCTGCGSCARACPEHAISMIGGRPDINYKKCIKCYCCHEMCPQKAIRLKRMFFK